MYKKKSNITTNNHFNFEILFFMAWIENQIISLTVLDLAFFWNGKICDNDKFEENFYWQMMKKTFCRMCLCIYPKKLFEITISFDIQCK